MRIGEIAVTILISSVAIGVVGLIVWAIKIDARQRSQCEAKGGKFVTGKSFSVCLDKSSVIDLN